MAKIPWGVDDGGSIPPTRSNPWVVGSSPSLAAKSAIQCGHTSELQ